MLCVGRPAVDPTHVVFYTGAIVAVCALGITCFTIFLTRADCSRYSYITAKDICALPQEQTRMVSFLHTRRFCNCILNSITGIPVESGWIASWIATGSVQGEMYFSGGTNIGGYYTPIFWAPFLLNETITFILVAYKSWESYKESRAARLSGNDLKVSLAVIIMKDNLLYFAM